VGKVSDSERSSIIVTQGESIRFRLCLPCSGPNMWWSKWAEPAGLQTKLAYTGYLHIKDLIMRKLCML